MGHSPMLSVWRLYLFIGAMGFFFLLAAAFLVGSAARVLDRGAPWPPRSRRMRRLRRVVFAFALLSLGLVVEANIEPWWPNVRRLSVSSPGWKGSRPLRIVHLSDLHCDPRPRLEPRRPDIVRALEPDLVVFTGDALNDAAGLPIFRACMTDLAKIAPTVAVRGNWDVWYYSNIDLFGGTGVRVLDGASARIATPAGDVWVGGAEVGGEAAFPGLLAAAPKDVFRVVLHHYPDEWVSAEAGGADLFLAGDVHGGQIALPLAGPLVRLSRRETYYRTGLSQKSRLRMHVSPGIGLEGGTTPRLRLFCRPEVTLLEISAGP